MRNGAHIYLILIFLLGGRLLTSAQEGEYFYDHFNISNGLISDMVYKIAFDREGHAWINTYNGIQKYNGYEFETYTSRQGDMGSLSSNYVVNMIEDRDGDLIVVLEDGVDIYNKQSGRFRNVLSDLQFVTGRRNEIIRSSAVQDKSGAIWAACNNNLVKIDSTKKDFIIYPKEYQGRFVLDSDSTHLWIITEESIKNYDLQSKVLIINSLRDVPGSGSIQRLNTLFFDSQGVLWVGTSNGLFILDERNLSFLDPGHVFPGLTDDHKLTLGEDITAIYEDYQNDLWIGAGSHLSRIERSTGRIQRLQHEFENPNSILGEQITGIHGNQTGHFWISYLNDGVTRINIKTSNFKSFKYRPDQINSLGGRSVRSVHKDEKGYLWVGLYNDGLDRIDPISGKISHFRHTSDEGSGIKSNYISALITDHRNRLWVGSHDNGLCYADHIYLGNLEFHTPSFLNGNDEIYHIQEDSLGRIWFGTRFGLGVFTYEDNAFHWVLRDHNTQSFIIDQKTIWIASWNNGLCKLVFSKDQFSADIPVFDSLQSIFYPVNDTIHGELPFKQINSTGIQNCISIYLDQAKQIWLGTYDRGLIKAIEKGEEMEFKRYSVSNGAPGNAVYGVMGDQSGNIWISTEQGLGKFNPTTERFENYFREDGLLSNYFMWKSYFKAPDGSLFFGTVDGLNYFHPHEILREKVTPSLLISELRINNHPVYPQDTLHGDIILDRQIIYQDTLVLNFWNRNFSFRYYAAGQVNPQRLTYSHMLVGFDDNWVVDDRGNRTASYNSLSPGTYIFRVRASGNDTEVLDGEAEKVVIILPPWWKTNLAVVVYLLLILGLIFLITHSLIRFLALKQELIYNEKLHQSKLMFFTNISHEFKTPLSLIKAPLDDILNEKELSPHNRRNLGIARNNAENLLKLVNELMEFRRTDTGNSKLRSELIELTGFLKEITRPFEYMAEQKGVHFYFNIPDETIQIWVDRKKFRRIVNNLLENALKYTGEEGLVTLSVITNPSQFKFKSQYHTLQLNQNQKEQESIGILVSDTGVGISRDSLPRIFDRFYQIDAEQASLHIGSGIGLALVKNLVIMHHGDIRVASERGIGTEILVLLPLGDDHLAVDEKLPRIYESVLHESDIRVPDQKTASDQFMEKPHGHVGIPKILLVEDHDELRQYLKEHLSDKYYILEAANGADGIRILHETRPDLIITDWIMPVMDGATMIQTIRKDESYSTVPIILLTAKDEIQERQQGLDMGADQVIPKPFNLQLLLSQVKRTIESNRTRARKFSTSSMESLVEIQESRDAQYMAEVERIIKKNMGDTTLNAETIAREMGVSRTSLYDKIKSITGQTIGEQIQQIRLKQAIRLMLYERISVSEVYFIVGFNSSSYMIRLFKKYYNTTPKEYIKRYLKTSSN